MSIKRVGVLGLGLMGSGIAQITAANAGLAVIALDSTEASLRKGIDSIRKSLSIMAGKAIAKGTKDKVTAEADVEKAMGLITPTTDRFALKGCDLVIEAAPEDWEFKRKLYQDLRSFVRSDAVLASNTSGLLIADLAREFGDPTRCLGMHYFNPVPLMSLCEVITTPTLSPRHLDSCIALIKAQGKTPVLCKDSPGFIVNRLLVPFLAQAIALHDRGAATTGDIDTAMKLGCGHPMGPLQLADYVGLDTTLFILQNWSKAYPGEANFAVPAGLKAKVGSGMLGRKSGKGYYHWEGDKAVKPVE